MVSNDCELNQKKMKKTLTLMTLLMLGNFMLHAQDKKKSETKFFAAFSAGPTFPVGVFGSTESKLYSDAGLAKVGYNLNLHTGYSIEKNFGLAATIMYSRYTLDDKAVNTILNGSGLGGTVSADHWQYWGVNIGPMATVDLSEKVFWDFKLLGGYARANAPVVKYTLEGYSSISTPEKWADAFTWQLGTDLRYNVASNVSLFGNLAYNYMKPTWKFSFASEDVSVYQRMGTLNLTIGAGVQF
jgi:hypothetical protein